MYTYCKYVLCKYKNWLSRTETPVSWDKIKQANHPRLACGGGCQGTDLAFPAKPSNAVCPSKRLVYESKVI